jgi:GT2 family glycosyltransferase
MKIETYNRAKKILESIEELKRNIKRYEREIYSDNPERVVRHFRGARKDARISIEKYKKEFERL